MTQQALVTVDRSVCVGNAMCVALAPTLFHLDDERQSVVSNAGPVGSEAAIDAAENCPVGAITVVEATTGEHLAP